MCQYHIKKEKQRFPQINLTKDKSKFEFFTSFLVSYSLWLLVYL